MNQAIIIGNLGRDPEVKSTPSGARFATLSVATSESWRDKNSGEKREKTEWHRVVVWSEGLVGVLEMYARKGGKVHVIGKVVTRKYDKNGVTHYATEIVVQGAETSVRLLGSASEASGGIPPPEGAPESRYGDSRGY